MRVKRYRKIPAPPLQRALVPVRPPEHLRRLPERRWPVRRRSSPFALAVLALTILTLSTVLVLIALNGLLLVIRSGEVPNQISMLNQLPTLTPTVSGAAIALADQNTGPVTAFSPTPTITASPTSIQNQPIAAGPSPVLQSEQQVAPTPSPTATPPPTPTRAPTPTPVPPLVAPETKSGGWSFVGTWANFAPRRKLVVLYGEMINDSGVPQKLSLVTGTFYDEQGQIIAANKSTYPTWPVNVVPPGGRLPFALTVYDIQTAANFELSVVAEAVDTAPRQDFEFVGVNEQMKGNNYCLTGALKNPGGTLEKQLVIAAILYDDQGNVLRFVENNETAIQKVVGDQALEFEVCLKSPPDNMARHELRAWGS